MLQVVAAKGLLDNDYYSGHKNTYYEKTSLVITDLKRDSMELDDCSETAYAKQHAMSKRGMCIFGPYFTGNSRPASYATSLRSTVLPGIPRRNSSESL